MSHPYTEFACLVCCQGLGQQVLHALGEQSAVELLRMPAQRLWAKERLMRLEKTDRLLERLGSAWRKQHPCGRVFAVGRRMQGSELLRVIGRDHRLQRASQAERNHRTPSRIRLKRDNPKVLQGWKDHRPTRRIVL